MTKVESDGKYMAV